MKILKSFKKDMDNKYKEKFDRDLDEDMKKTSEPIEVLMLTDSV
jgi:hypothetical protein